MKYKKGFTLIEMLIVVALIAAVSLLMYTFFGQGLNLYTFEANSADQQADLRQVLSDITNRARLTDAASVTCSAGVLNVGSYKYALSGDTVTRNGTVIADNITTFSPTITSGILHIGLANASGESIDTSFSLLK